MTAPAVEFANGAAAQALLGPQTVGILLRNIWRTYRQYFGVLMACSLLPMLPFIVVQEWLTAIRSSGALVGGLPYLVAGFVAGGAMTVVISNICLGNRPTVPHAYGHILGQRRWWRMLSTGLLLVMMIYAGFLLLLLPGVWVMARGSFSSIVVVLEGRKNMDAIKRSFALTKGQAWRVVGLTVLPLLLASIPMFLVGLVVTMVGTLTLGESVAQDFLVKSMADVLSQALLAPVWGITLVLLYYDQRVRREAYDVQALAEDLMR
jgi:hypothetical protein